MHTLTEESRAIPNARLFFEKVHVRCKLPTHEPPLTLWTALWPEPSLEIFTSAEVRTLGAHPSLHPETLDRSLSLIISLANCSSFFQNENYNERTAFSCFSCMPWVGFRGMVGDPVSPAGFFLFPRSGSLWPQLMMVPSHDILECRHL